MSVRWRRIGLSQLIGFAAGPWIVTGPGQELRAHGEGTGCPPCEIRIEEVITLQGSEAAMRWHRQLTPTIVRDGRGWYYVAPMADMKSIGVYRPGGQFERVIAGAGKDGDWFAFVTEVKIRNDTLIAVDRGGGELDLVHRNGSGRVATTLGYGPEGVLPLSDGRYVTQLSLPSPQLIGFPVHLHGFRGEHIRSFGRSGDRVSPDAPYNEKRNIAHGPNGSILLTRVNQYRIEKWTLAGSLLAVIERERSWFAPWREMPGKLAGGAPSDLVRFGAVRGRRRTPVVPVSRSRSETGRGLRRRIRRRKSRPLSSWRSTSSLTRSSR